MTNRKTETASFGLTENGPGESVRSVNLIARREGGETFLSPAPAVVKTVEGAWRPWHTHYLPDGSAAEFVHSPSTARGVSRIGILGDGGVTQVGVTEGEPHAAVSLDASKVSFCAGGRRRQLMLDGATWRLDDPAEGTVFPRLKARLSGTVSAQTGPLTFKGVSAGTLHLSESQTAELSRRLADAYDDLCATAAAGGLWLQPMLVAVRLKDAHGATVGVTAPLLMSPAGWQCTGEITADATLTDDALSVADLRLEADGYVIDAEFPDDVAGTAAFAEVWALTQAHPLDRDASAPVRLTTRSGATKLATALPGATTHFASADSRRRRELSTAAAHVIDCGECIGRYDLSASAGTTAILRCSGSDTTTWQQTLASCRRQATAAVTGDEDSATAAIRGGAEFTAATAARSGDAVVWGDITVTRRGGQSPAVFMADGEESGSWQAAVEVTMADGRRVVTHFDGTGEAPVSLRPMVSYPSRQAVSLRLTVDNDMTGTRRAVSLPLTAAADGSDLALYIGSGAIALEVTADAFPAETAPDARRYPSMVLLCPADDALSPVAAVTAGTAAIKRMVSAVRSHNSWDASRSRFLVFSAEGLTAVNASTRTATLSATLLDSTVTRGTAAVAATPCGVISASGGCLVLCGSSGVKVIERTERPLTALAWHTPTSTLAAIDAAGNVSLRGLTDIGAVSSVTQLSLPFTPEALFGAPDGCTRLATAGALHTLTDLCAPTTRIAIEADMVTALSRRPATAVIDMTASKLTGTATLRTAGATLVKLAIDGALRSPIAVRLAAPPRRRLTLAVEADVAADFRLYGASLVTLKARCPK